MTSLEERVSKAVLDQKLFGPGDRVLVAVSGGLDSMVLLHLLLKVFSGRGMQLAVAHFNHQLRGRSSDADERLVRRTAEKLGLKAFCGRGNVRKFSERNRLSIEMAARTLRHGFLSRIGVKRGFARVALAHHADDQVELFLLRLLRGAGPEALGGMRWMSPSPADRRVKLVRPLLSCRKLELQEYAREHRIAYREDGSNSCLDFLRNRLRHELLPLLRREYQPAIDSILSRFMDIVGSESEVVAGVAAEALKQLKSARGPAFKELPVAVQRRCIRLQLLQHGISPEFDLIEKLRKHEAKAVTTPSSSSDEGLRLLVLRDLGGLLRLETAKKRQFTDQAVSISLGIGAGEGHLNGVRLHWRLVRAPKTGRGKFRAGRELFDADQIGTHIVVRHWRPGDRFQPIGTRSAVKLQDLFTNAKVPRQERHELVLAATGSGEIFWVEGLRISERFKLTAGTSRCLQWGWERF